MIQMRYDEERGVYRDCKWCGGKGCLACPAESEKEYKRQFPDGPKPVLSVPNTPAGIKRSLKFLMKSRCDGCV
jgi:hypothetical protein